MAERFGCCLSYSVLFPAACIESVETKTINFERFHASNRTSSKNVHYKSLSCTFISFMSSWFLCLYSPAWLFNCARRRWLAERIRAVTGSSFFAFPAATFGPIAERFFPTYTIFELFPCRNNNQTQIWQSETKPRLRFRPSSRLKHFHNSKYFDVDCQSKISLNFKPIWKIIQGVCPIRTN